MNASRSGYDWGAQLPTLTGERVVLRALADDDVPALFEIFSDAEVMRYWSRPPMTSLAEATALRREIEDAFQARALFQWGVTRAGGQRVIGTCTLFRIDHTHQRAEIGYALGRAHWGQGLASATLALAIAFAFGTLGLHRLEADVDPRNDRSLRVLERQGFEREGLLRERYQVAGEIQDAVLLGLLQPNWASRTRAGAPRPRSGSDADRG